MVIIYNFVCDECGACLQEENIADHCYEHNHRYIKFIGMTKSDYDKEGG